MRKKPREPEEKTRKKEKWGAPIPTIMTPWGELTLPEAAAKERDGTYHDPPD